MFQLVALCGVFWLHWVHPREHAKLSFTGHHWPCTLIFRIDALYSSLQFTTPHIRMVWNLILASSFSHIPILFRWLWWKLHYSLNYQKNWEIVFKFVAFQHLKKRWYLWLKPISRNNVRYVNLKLETSQVEWVWIWSNFVGSLSHAPYSSSNIDTMTYKHIHRMSHIVGWRLMHIRYNIPHVLVLVYHKYHNFPHWPIDLPFSLNMFKNVPTHYMLT